jgi:hypothetical protein
LRIQQRIKNAELGISVDEPDRELPDFPSFIPFLPPLVCIHAFSAFDATVHGYLLRYQNFTLCEQSAANLKVYYATCFTLIAGIMVFGGFLAPIVSYKFSILDSQMLLYCLYCHTKCIAS